jgi:hypothetical protein
MISRDQADFSLFAANNRVHFGLDFYSAKDIKLAAAGMAMFQ